MTNTTENLKNAFAGESQAAQKYQLFARQAQRDGLPNIAKLFRTTARAERIHAAGHFKAMDGTGSTVDNIQAAIDGETYEYTQMYPPMLDQAEEDGHKARRMFAYALKVEDVHAQLYSLALEAAKNGTDLDTTDFYLCPICGHIEFGNPPDACPVCRTKGSKYIQL